jgi:tetratricopeptide (TPR) repeat protein
LRYVFLLALLPSFLAPIPLRAGETGAGAPELDRIEKALESLRSRFFDEREKGMQSLVSLAKTRKVAVGERLMSLLEDSDPRLRLLGIRLLGEIAYEPALPRIAALIPEMDTASAWERATLIEAFEKYGTAAERHILEKGFDSKPLGRIVLGRSALPDVLKFIKAFLDDEGNSGWYDGQFEALRPRGKSVIYALMLVVENYFTPHDLTLLEATGMKAYTILWLALHGLGELGDPAAVPLLKSIDRNADAIQRDWSKLPSLNITGSFTRFIRRFATIACWKCGDREPLVQRVRILREEISELAASVKPRTGEPFGWNRDPREQMGELADLYWDLAVSLSSFGLVEEVVEAYRRNMDWRQRLNPDSREYAVAQYNIACAWSKANKPKKGLQALEEAFRIGYGDLAWIEKDGDLESVRALPEYHLVIAYAHVQRLKDSVDLEEELEKTRREILRQVGAAVTYGLTDPSWIEHKHFVAVRNEPEFHWHAARFHARAGRAEACARWLRTALERDAARMKNVAPEERNPAVRLEDVKTSEDFRAVRDHPAVRAVLRGHGGK